MAPQTSRLSPNSHAYLANASTVRSASTNSRSEINDDLTQLAHQTWLSDSPGLKIRSDLLLDQLWPKLEANGFSNATLSQLESLQIVERCLWPIDSDDVSNRHILLLALLTNVKVNGNMKSWGIFADQPDRFSVFFRRVLKLVLDKELPYSIRTPLICFLISAFGSLDEALVRKECAPLVSASILHNIHSEAARLKIFESAPVFKKAWRASTKRLEAATGELKAKLIFDRSWIYTLMLTFFSELYNISQSTKSSAIVYCERVLELLIDLESQVPTRRYLNSLLHNLNIIPVVRLSPFYTDESNLIFRELFDLFQHYYHFPIDDQTGASITSEQQYKLHCELLRNLQITALEILPERLKLLILSNYGALSRREELLEHLHEVSEEDIHLLCKSLDLRLEYPPSCMVPSGNAFLRELLVSFHENPISFRETVGSLRVMPTEKHLYEPVLARNEVYDGTRAMAIPKLNLQYLTMGDFLWRSFVLHRYESFYAIRKHVEDVVKRMRPKKIDSGVKFEGASRMAIPVNKVAITDVAPSNVGEFVPARVLAEISLDVYYLTPHVRAEWESLKPDDVVFLAQVEPPQEVVNGHLVSPSSIRRLRTAEVLYVADSNGRMLRDTQPDNGRTFRRRELRLILKLDSHAYHDDKDPSRKHNFDVYEHINLVIRRKSRENNFKPILQSIRKLTLSDAPAPSWLREVFLGYGDPANADFSRLTSRLQKIDLGDTFLDWNHLSNSFPGRSVIADETTRPGKPPFVLEFQASARDQDESKTSKKRRRDHNDEPRLVPDTVLVSTYEPVNSGPYPSDEPKLNTVRFTPAQVEAIISGVQPGLTVIVGPPGTGKTDVATQVINTLYHNFPNQRTLLIAHSNQALNQLFQKIAILDIDERHLLRLGHGEEDLEMTGSYSKHGRVESFLEIGGKYLAEVNRLAASLNAPGAHGNSCETADYFNQVYVKPAWTRYWEKVTTPQATAKEAVLAFPFMGFFSNAPQPLFSNDLNKEAALEIAAGCYRHIEKMFSELESVRPFEILRNPRDRANYLLVKEARIIAMTSTHAAMRREEILNLGFRYDNVVIEEAAQITEIETFIPLALQKPLNGDLPLKRIMLCGDHLQNSPIIQNAAFRQYARLEQSLFQRLVRLGVPTIMLDKQGRARPSIAALYRWRYPRLGNLPNVETDQEYLHANAGFRYEYQFIDVPDYKGKGEHEPTPHFIQNLGEAEYAVAIYMYMRLLGYPASKISILTTYAGQKALIRDVLMHRCAKSKLFGLPRIVATVDKYQGEQNDYVILSLVRTSRVGYLRDIRRLTVALSRARLGLYILGRRSVFESSLEMKPALSHLFSRPTKLLLTTNELHPTTRLMADRRPAIHPTSQLRKRDKNPNAASSPNSLSACTDISLTDPLPDEGSVPTFPIEGVEHLGQYVFEMTRAKSQALNSGDVVLAEEEDKKTVGIDEEDDDDPDAVMATDDDFA